MRIDEMVLLGTVPSKQYFTTQYVIPYSVQKYVNPKMKARRRKQFARSLIRKHRILKRWDKGKPRMPIEKSEEASLTEKKWIEIGK